MFNLQIIKSVYKPFIVNWLMLIIISTFSLISFMTKTSAERFTTMLPILLAFQTLFQSAVFMRIANALVTNEVERGHLVYFFSSSLTRANIIMSKMSFYIILLFITNLVLLIEGIILISIFKVNIGYDKFALLVLGLFSLSFFVCGIFFFFSTIFNRSIWLLTLGAGVIFVLYILFGIMVISAEEHLHIPSYLSLKIFYDPSAILAKTIDKWIPQMIVSFSIGLTLYIGSVFIFKNKDLPL